MPAISHRRKLVPAKIVRNQAALIRQLGEALNVVYWSARDVETETSVNAALTAYETWKAQQGEGEKKPTKPACASCGGNGYLSGLERACRACNPAGEWRSVGMVHDVDGEAE